MSSSNKLNDPLRIGKMEIRNRLYRAPVLEGAGTRESWADLYKAAFLPNAKAGVGAVIQGNSIVLNGGQTSPGMITTEDRDLMKSLEPMTRSLHDAGAKIIIQLGHGGIYCLSSWSKKIRQSNPVPMIAPSPLPRPLRWVHPGAKALTTEEVRSLIDRFAESALWAREAGYDAVQLASGNAKLLHQFLTPMYNRRDDEFGGSIENRMRILLEIRQSIAQRAGEDFPVLVKIPFADHKRGITFEEGLRMCKLAEEMGFDAITPVFGSHLPSSALCRGDFPAGSYANPRVIREYKEHMGSSIKYQFLKAANRRASNQYPFRPLWNREVFRAAKQAVSIPVFAVGGIRSLGEIEEVLGAGDADMIGIGRPFYAEPELPRRLLAGDGRETACANCNRCIPPQMLGWKGACYNPDLAKRRAALNS